MEENQAVENNNQEMNNNNNEGEVVTFTQEQVDNKFAEYKKQLEAEYKAKLADGIKNGIDEAEKYKAMTEKEKFETDKKKFEDEKKAFQVERMTIGAMKTLTSKDYGFSGENAEKICKYLNFESAETMDASIKEIGGVIKEIAESLVKSNLKTNSTPSTPSTDVNTISTKEQAWAKFQETGDKQYYHLYNKLSK